MEQKKQEDPEDLIIRIDKETGDRIISMEGMPCESGICSKDCKDCKWVPCG